MGRWASKVGAAALLLIVIIIGIPLGFMLWSQIAPQLQTIITQPMQVAPAQTQQTAQQVAPPGKIYGQIQDIDTGTALGGTSAKVDIIDPADLTKPLETVTVDTSTKTFVSGLLYEPGRRLLLHIYSTEGNGYYDEIKEIVVPSNYAMIGNEYRYYVGVFGLKQRAGASEINFRLLDPTGATLSSATGSTAGSAGSYSAGAKTFDLTLSISLSAYKRSWGRPMPYINSRYERINLVPVVWIAFNNTAISATKLTNEGWIPVTSTAFTGWLVFYKPLSEVVSTQTSLGSTTVRIPIDASSLPSGAAFKIYVWIADLQNEADAKAGVGWSSITAYGAFSGHGVTSPLGGVFQTAGGQPTNPWLQAVITVP